MTWFWKTNIVDRGNGLLCKTLYSYYSCIKPLASYDASEILVDNLCMTFYKDWINVAEIVSSFR